MKNKVTLIVASILLSFAFAACNTTESELDKAVKAANKDCPLDFGDGSFIEKIETNDSTVIYTISIPEEDGFTVDQLNNPFVMYLLKLGYSETLPSFENEAIQQIVQLSHADSMSTIMRHVGKESKMTVDINISNEEWSALEEISGGLQD
ncbi:MAG: hypothetical protein J5808_02285 [Paludibacteraceae bacterium]|nr:hypothetical protein [Paludibacteraceae bacterium]